MPDEVKDQTEQPQPQDRTQDAMKLLAKFPGAPTQETINSWKAQVPGGRVRLWASSDWKRVYVMRGIGGLELAQLQASVAQLHQGPNVTPDKLMTELQIAVACKCCLWTSTSANGQLTEMNVRQSGAGLPVVLHEVVSVLSDFEDPETIERFSADL